LHKSQRNVAIKMAWDQKSCAFFYATCDRYAPLADCSYSYRQSMAGTYNKPLKIIEKLLYLIIIINCFLTIF
jgi:hypothetical protein